MTGVQQCFFFGKGNKPAELMLMPADKKKKIVFSSFIPDPGRS